MSGIRTIAEILVIFQSFMCVMVALTSCFPTRNLHEVHIRSAPNWSINPNEKRCLDFCVYVNCNFGTCHQDPKNCGLSCTCDDGYHGRRCTKKISPETTSASIINITPQRPISHNVNTTRLKPQHTPDIVRRRLENVGGEDNNTKTKGISEFGKTLSDGKSDDYQNITPNPLIFQETVPSDIVSTIAGFVEGATKSASLSSVTSASTNKAKDTTTQNSIDLSTQSQTSSTLLSKTESFGKVFIPNNGLISMKSAESKTNESEITNSSNITKWNYTSKYLDNCKTHCYEGVCIPEENKSKFHCLPKNHGCQKGFHCTYGVCQITSGFTQVICICEPGYIGDFCHKRCDLKCEGGGCVVSKGVKSCICPEGRTGRNCERLMPKEKGISEEKWYWYVVGACAGLVVIFLVILITVPYCLWKKRYLFVMKIVHFFQDYEEDDGKEYDAFISYKSSKEDQDFVLRQLYPKLEQEMGFKLCMHFRDFTPGDVIANNIIRAIENSRRTIMILSPNYVDSEWCRMEYQKAQHEMLKRRHKIIPILFKDISEASNYDKNLDIILNTVTYIEWPGEDNAQKLEKFWNQMRLSLPKKRTNISSPSSPSPPTSTDTTISFSDPNMLSYTDSSPKANVSSIVPTLAVSDSSKALSDQDTLENENSKGRLRKIVKDMLKLKIHSRSNSFVRLHREGSLESAPSTPSPGLCIDKDMNPLINRKKSNKSSTWSAKTLQHTLKPCARSHSEKNCSIKKLDVIQQSHGQRDELPDICKCSDESYINVVCNVSDQSYNITENDYGKNNSNEEQSQNLSNIFNDKNNYESNISLKEETIQSLSHQFHSCETCVFPKEVDNNKYKNLHDNNCETCIMNCETSNTQCDNTDNKCVNAISKDTEGRSFRLISRKKDIPRRYSDGENFNIYTSSYNKCHSKQCGLHGYISDRNANNQSNGNAFLMDQNISVSEQVANTKEPCKTCVMTLNKDANYNVNIDPDLNSNSNVSNDMNIEFNIHARCETKILNTAQGEYTPRGPSSGINRRLSAPNNCLSERPFVIPRRDKIRRESAPQTFSLVNDLKKNDTKSPQPVKRTLETLCDPPKPPKRTKRRKNLRK